jgi:hypothetical protein
MTEKELVRFDKAAQERCLKTVEKKLLIELEEARAEWRRRHPKRRAKFKRLTFPKVRKSSFWETRYPSNAYEQPVKSISLAVVVAAAVTFRVTPFVSRFVVCEGIEQIVAPPDMGFVASASTE